MVNPFDLYNLNLNANATCKRDPLSGLLEIPSTQGLTLSLINHFPWDQAFKVHICPEQGHTWHLLLGGISSIVELEVGLLVPSGIGNILVDIYNVNSIQSDIFAEEIETQWLTGYPPEIRYINMGSLLRLPIFYKRV